MGCIFTYAYDTQRIIKERDYNGVCVVCIKLFCVICTILCIIRSRTTPCFFYYFTNYEYTRNK